MKPQTLLLWDIDGTLIWTGGAGIEALNRTIREVFRIPVKTILGEVDVAGRTDIFIIKSIFRKFHIPLTGHNIHRFTEGYVERLPAELHARPGRVLNGIRDILERADAQPDLVQGLLTGNLRRSALLKLTHYGIRRYFRLGAFGDRCESRNQLARNALRTARRQFPGAFVPSRVFVIGDTPHDIRCGQALGAQTIAVATGTYGLRELKACNPTALFRDFRRPDPFFQLLDTHDWNGKTKS